MKRRITKLLVANRGEIARRIMRTAHELGVTTVAIFGEADRHGLHAAEADEAIFIGDEQDGLPYLDGARVIAAAQRCGADAIHPGYGFLAESPAFARAVVDAGLMWIGPPPEAMEMMAAKDAAKERAQAAGVPVVPGFSCDGMDDAAIGKGCAELGYPVLLKAVAGGGGRGMRVVEAADKLAETLTLARAEALSAFADERLLVERYVANGRHVEVQIFADMHGNAVHLFERECSIQRRHQKLVEESPSPGISKEVRAAICDAAVRLAHAIGYVGAGTVEFLVDADRGDYHFLEVNARIQVEHPVTELRTDTDLVAWQLRVAEGRLLPLRQAEIEADGHAIEVRLCAEDPTENHRPQAGEVLLWRGPDRVRVDSGLGPRDRVSMHYDSMVAKIIVHARSRRRAVVQLRHALRETVLLGLPSNRPLLLAILDHDAFLHGDTTTRFLDEHALAQKAAQPEDHVLLAAALWVAGDGLSKRFRSNAWRPDITVFSLAGEPLHVALQRPRTGPLLGAVHRDPDPLVARPPSASIGLDVVSRTDNGIVAEIDGRRRRYHVGRHGDELWIQPHLGPAFPLAIGTLLPEPEQDELAAGAIASPTAAVVTEVHVEVGQQVQADDALVTVEAMKMLTVLRASTAGEVSAIHAAKGESVGAGAVLVEIDDRQG